MSATKTTARDEALRVLEAEISAERLAWIDTMTVGQAPMEKWMRHTGVSTWGDLMQWAMMKQREILIIRSARDGEDGPSKDELGDYLVGKDAALAELLANMRQIVERSAENG